MCGVVSALVAHLSLDDFMYAYLIAPSSVVFPVKRTAWTYLYGWALKLVSGWLEC